MTVHELTEQLQKIPNQDANVWCECDATGGPGVYIIRRDNFEIDEVRKRDGVVILQSHLLPF